MVIDANGNVGIGTTNPQAKLDVRGDLTVEEYKELITLEYVLTWGYGSPEDDERFKELRIKKHGK